MWSLLLKCSFITATPIMKYSLVYAIILSILAADLAESAILNQPEGEITLREEVNRYKALVEQQQLKLNAQEELIKEIHTFLRPLVIS